MNSVGVRADVYAMTADLGYTTTPIRHTDRNVVGWKYLPKRNMPRRCCISPISPYAYADAAIAVDCAQAYGRGEADAVVRPILNPPTNSLIASFRH